MRKRFLFMTILILVLSFSSCSKEQNLIVLNLDSEGYLSQGVPLNIRFNSWIDKESFNKSIKINPEIFDYEYEWDGFDEVNISSQEFQLGQKYNIQIAETLTDVWGGAISEDPILDTHFVISKGLEVEYFSYGTDVESSRDIINVIFSQAVQNDQKMSSYIQFEPELEGELQWWSDLSFSFYPKTDFEKATEYQVTIPQKVKSIYGGHLPEDYISHFATDNLQIQSTHPSADDNLLGITESIQIDFNQAVDLKTIAQYLNLYELAVSGERELNFSIKAQDDNKTIFIIPDLNLTYDRNYKLIVNAGIQPKNGTLILNESQVVNFVTAPKAAVISSNLDDPDFDMEDDLIEVQFNSPMDLGVLEKNIRIEPKLAITDSMLSKDLLEWTFKLSFEPDQKYKIIFNKNIQDKFKQNLIEEENYNLGPYSLKPKAKIVSDALSPILFSVNSTSLIDIETINLDKVNIKICQLSLEDFLKYKSFLTNYSCKNEVNFEQKVKNTFNIPSISSIDMGPHLPINEEGIFFVSINSDDAVIVFRNSISLIIEQIDQKTLIWLNDIEKGQVIDGAELRIYDGLDMIDLGASDASGVYIYNGVLPEDFFVIANINDNYGMYSQLSKNPVNKVDSLLNDLVSSADQYKIDFHFSDLHFVNNQLLEFTLSAKDQNNLALAFADIDLKLVYEGESVYSQKVRLDQGGNYSFSSPITLKQSSQGSTLLVEATLLFNDKKIIASQKLNVLPSQYYLGFESIEDKILEEGQDLKFQVKAFDLQTHPIANLPLNIYLQKKDASNKVNIASSLKTSNEGLLDYTLKPDEEGEFLISIEAKDPLGNIVSTSSSFYVYKQEDDLISIVPSQAGLDFVFDKISYQVGDQVSLLINSIFDKSKALVAIDGVDLVDYFLLDLDNTSLFNFGDLSKYSRGSQVSILLHKPRYFSDVLQAGGSESLSRVPLNLFINKPLIVDNLLNDLTLSVEMNKLIFSPSEQVKVQLSLSSASDAPLQHNLSIKLYNKFDYLTQIQNHYLGKIINYWTNLSFLSEVKSNSFDYLIASNLQEQDYSYLEFESQTNEEGKSNFDFFLPEYFADYILEITVLDEAQQLLIETFDVLASAPLDIEAYIPSYLSLNDKAIFAFTMSSHLNRNLEGDLFLKIQDRQQNIVFEEKKTINILANNSIKIEFPWDVNVVSENLDLSYEFISTDYEQSNHFNLQTYQSDNYPLHNNCLDKQIYDSLFTLSVESLKQFQNEDGGFVLCLGDLRSDVQISAYVLYFWSAYQALELDLDNEVQLALLSYLQQLLYDPSLNDNLRVFILYTLNKFDFDDDYLLNELYLQRNNLSLVSHGYLLEMLSDSSRYRAEVLFSEILAKIKVQETYNFFEERTDIKYSSNSNLLASSSILSAFLYSNEDQDIVDPLVNYVHMQLNDFQNYSYIDLAFAFAVLLKNQLSIANLPNQVVLSLPSDSPPSIQVYGQYADLQSGLTAENFNLNRSYKYSIILTVQKESYDLILDDLLSPNFQFLGSGQLVETSTAEIVQYEKINSIDDLVMIHIPHIKKGIYHLEYYLDSQISGKYQDPPLMIYELYNPKVYGQAELNFLETTSNVSQ